MAIVSAICAVLATVMVQAVIVTALAVNGNIHIGMLFNHLVIVVR